MPQGPENQNEMKMYSTIKSKNNFSKLLLKVTYGKCILLLPYGRTVYKSTKWKGTQIASGSESINKTMVHPYKAIVNNNSKERDPSI